ncbi:MAG: SPOR domain-containing protein [Mariprofundus sp.]|nr:SPOR domain-containing protein [Mariprofundus sp.]
MVRRQDFAQLKAPSQQQEKPQQSMLPLMMLLIALFCFGAGYWLASSQKPAPAFSKGDLDKVHASLQGATGELKQAHGANDALQRTVTQLQEKVALLKSRVEQGAHAKVGDLQFYNELPKQSVTPEPVVGPAAVARVMPEIVAQGTEKGASTSGFSIQIASFRSKVDAIHMQEKLQKNGFQIYLKRIDLAEKGAWFRVYAGPYLRKSDAEQLLPELEAQKHVKKGLVISGG